MAASSTTPASRNGEDVRSNGNGFSTQLANWRARWGGQSGRSRLVLTVARTPAYARKRSAGAG
eukprot:384413-Alexandrium_andersonii.AAC.1